ncbi:hypothetical protein CEXT_90031 [Caerostris extrusa]|uniref:Uncharacterized protein n=1 Tax=Caerostris extrusa TaxID=172846 RepID=A0AAV4WQM0_CAEEX|nr:hypothetical protein CEXT_90031 [Caerostris extrusa]
MTAAMNPKIQMAHRVAMGLSGGEFSSWAQKNRFFSEKANVVSTSSLPPRCSISIGTFFDQGPFLFGESNRPSMIMIKTEITGIVSVFEILEHNNPRPPMVKGMQ